MVATEEGRSLNVWVIPESLSTEGEQSGWPDGHRTINFTRTAYHGSLRGVNALAVASRAREELSDGNPAAMDPP